MVDGIVLPTELQIGIVISIVMELGIAVYNIYTQYKQYLILKHETNLSIGE